MFHSNRYQNDKDFIQFIEMVKNTDEHKIEGKIEKIQVKMKNGEIKEKKIDKLANLMKGAQLKNITIKGRCIDLFKYLAN